jgi:4-amino-4-deoxy-L-arabinose transferase-like glycosyltransferase
MSKKKKKKKSPRAAPESIRTVDVEQSTEAVDQTPMWRSSPALVIYSTLFAAVISFVGIGNNPFWDDEANTAVIGRNFIETGTLSAWDGRNLLSYGMRGSINEDMEKTSAPPLQYIVAGISFWLFGESTTGGRLLFLLVGLLCIPLAALYYRAEFGSKKYWVPAFVLALSVAYLLYIRQARYYPLCLTFSLGMLWAWAKARDTKKLWVWIVTGVVFGALITMSHYLYSAAIVGIVCASFIRGQYRTKNSYIFLAVLGCMGIVGLVTIYLYNPGSLAVAFAWETGDRGSRFDRFCRFLWMVPRDMARFEFVPIGVLLFWGAGMALLKKKSVGSSRRIGVVLFYMAMVVVAVSFISFQPILRARNVDMRYYTTLIPLGAILVALIYELLEKTRHKWLPPVFVILVVSSNLLTFNFIGEIGLHSRIVEYFHENTNDYLTGAEAVQNYLEENVNEDECVFMAPMYLNIIHMFYRPQQKFCGLVSTQAAFAKKHGAGLRPGLFFENVVPEYFFVARREEKIFAQNLEILYGEGTYTLVDNIPVYWREQTRPEIAIRSFGPTDVTDPKAEGILVFRRTTTPAHLPTLDGIKAELVFRN